MESVAVDLPEILPTGEVTESAGLTQATRRLSKEAHTVYRLLTRRGPMTLAELQESTSMRASDLSNSLQGLTYLELIRDSPEGYLAIPHSQVIDELLYAQAVLLGRVLTHLSERHRVLQSLIAERDALDAGSSMRVQAWSVPTDDRSGLYDVPTRSDSEISAIHPGGQFAPELLERSLARAEASLARGVRMRVIHQSAALQHPGQVRYMQAIEDLGGRVRVRDNLPFRLLLSDGAAAVCSVSGAGGDTDTFLLRGNQMVTMLERVFEATWVDAVPLNSAVGRPGGQRELTAPSGLNSQQESILRLLAEGQTDQAIARQLGITTRTVTRRIGEIYESLGVDSRFQAGVAAQRLGLV